MVERPLLVAILCAAFLAELGAGHGVAAGARRQAQAAPAAGAPHPRTVLVFPFENAGRLPNLDWLGEGLAELTIDRLAGQKPQTFSREERLAALEKMGLPGNARLSRATMFKVAEEVDADDIVFGEYSSDGKSVEIRARVLRANPPELSPDFRESGALADLMDVHGRLLLHLLCWLEPADQLGGACEEGSVAARGFPGKLVRIRPDAFEDYIRGLLAALPGDRKEDEEQLRLLRLAARLEPEWPDPAYALGKAYFEHRDCESALAWLSRVPPADKHGTEASFDAGVCLLLLNDAARAEAAFTGLLERGRSAQPESGGDLPEALNNLGIARARLGRFPEARADLERASQLDPREVDYWFNLGLTNLQAKDPAAAVEALRKALALRPEDAEARALLVAALETSGHGDEAAAVRSGPAGAGERAPQLPAITPESLSRMGRVKMHLDVALLRPLYTGSSGASGSRSTRGTEPVQLHLARGRQFLTAGQLDEAQRAFTEAIQAAPLDPDGHLGLAEVYRRQGRPDDAIREMRAALATRDDAPTRTALARLYLQQNRIAEAREELRQALKLDPTYQEARQLLDQLEGRAGPGEPR